MVTRTHAQTVADPARSERVARSRSSALTRALSARASHRIGTRCHGVAPLGGKPRHCSPYEGSRRLCRGAPTAACFLLRTKVGCRQRRRAGGNSSCRRAQRSPVLRKKLRMATHWPEARALARSGASLMMPVPGHWQKKVEGRPAASGRAGPPAPPMAHPRGKARRARLRWALAGPQGPMAWPPVSMRPVDFKFPGRVGRAWVSGAERCHLPRRARGRPVSPRLPKAHHRAPPAGGAHSGAANAGHRPVHMDAPH